MDAAERPIEAVAAYEEAITAPDAGLDSFLDLAVLYFCCYDFGYAAHHQLPDDLFRNTWDGIDATLDAAITRFGSHPEILCWRMYIDFIIGKTNNLDQGRIQELLATGQTLLPYLCLFGSFVGLGQEDRQQYRAGAARLLIEAQPRRTERQRYVFSVLDSALRRETSSR